MPRTTRYNAAASGSFDSEGFLLLRRWPETYEFSIQSNGRRIKVEIAPEAARRLRWNLTATLQHNGHLPEASLELSGAEWAALTQAIHQRLASGHNDTCGCSLVARACECDCGHDALGEWLEQIEERSQP